MGLWDGDCFLVIAEKFEDYVIKLEPYYTSDTGCFQPFAIVDEGVMVEPFGRVGWDKHYGQRLEFDMNDDKSKAHSPTPSISDPESGNMDLIGIWKGSHYLSDGLRSNITLALNADESFSAAWVGDPPRPNAPPRTETGHWLHAKDENLLVLRPDRANEEARERFYRILHYSGSTMMLRWVALASRNLPFLLYRTRVSAQETVSRPGTCK